METREEISTVNKVREKISTVKLFGYALGEGAVSITMNGIANFAMLFYTQILVLSASYFKTSLGGIMAKLLAPTLFIAAAGILMAMLCG